MQVLYTFSDIILLVRSMQRSILLQINPTKRKYAELEDFSDKATAEYNRLRAERDFCLKFMDFHRKVYSTSKSITSFNVQIICDIERSVWRSKGISKGITVKFNVPRNCKTFSTKSMTFCQIGNLSKKYYCCSYYQEWELAKV